MLSELLDPGRIRAGELDPDAEALTDGRERLTWAGYVDRVGRLAAALADRGVGSGDRVVVHLHKSVDAFVAVHAVLRAGAVMVPADPLAPPDYVAAVVADAGARVLITDARGAALIRVVEAARPGCVVLLSAVTDPLPCDVVTRDDVDRAVPGPRAPASPGDPAYVIYTSGSTGRPKGIVHTHASALAYARLAAAEYGLDRTDRLANIAPLHFDQSTFELYAAPLVAAAVLVVPEPVMRFPASLSDLVASERITVWYSVPYLLEQLAERGVLAERDLSQLRWVLFGGESFAPESLAALMALVPSATFSNVYGPAEVNQCTRFHLATPPPAGEPVPIGRAWADTELLVVDDAGRRVAPEVRGELLVRSTTMMARYWNRPDLTAAAITRRPGPAGDDQRWYATGDLVVERPDGNLVFVGRADNQVKLRGHRIELEAIDAVLDGVPAVAESIAVVERPPDGDDRIVALVVLRRSDAPGDADGAVEAIVEELRHRLPRYAVPSLVVPVAALPRTATGKLDRGAAGGLLAVGPAAATADRAP